MTYANGRSGRRKPGAPTRSGRRKPGAPTRSGRRTAESARAHAATLRDNRRRRSLAECDADFTRLRPDGKACKSCGEVFNDADAFPRDRTRADGRNTRCRRCANRKRTVADTHLLRAYWVARGIDPDRCFYCPAPATQVEHFRARALGGTDAFTNLVPACQPCNYAKRDLPVVEWLNRLLRKITQ